MKHFNKVFALGAVLILGGLALSACGNNDLQTSSTNQSSGSKAERVLTDSMGNEVTIPAKPKKIIGSYLEDYIVALGEKPIAQWTVNNASIQDYLADELKNVPTISYNLPYEEVLKFEPDLLLVSSTALVEGGKYEEYSKIAPTYVVVNGENVTWREQLEDVAKVLDKKKEAEKVLSDYDKLAEETKAKLAETLPEESAAVLWITNNQVFAVSSTRSSGTVLYTDLGLAVPNLIEEISEKATADWSAVSLEKLAELDADHIFLVNSDPSAALFNGEVWKNLEAVKKEQVYEFDGKSSWLYNGPIANTKIIEDVNTSLLK